MHRPVDRTLVGFADSSLSPTDDPRKLGAVRMDPPGPFTVRQSVDLRITYTIGHHGLDDRGAVKIVMRFPADGGGWQTDTPDAPNFVRAQASAPCRFRIDYAAFGHARPWFKVLTVQVIGGCLRENDTLTISVDGLRLQTFSEEAWELRFLVDACATGHFVEVPDTLWATIAAGPPATWHLVAPTRWPVGEPLRLGLKAEDAHGNPTADPDATWHLSADASVDGLPAQVARTGVAEVLEITPKAKGILRITARDAEGTVRAVSNPIRVGLDRTLWGDLHGQSGETVGINTARAFFLFARDAAFLDATSHQGNAFQISGAFWRDLNALTAEFDDPGRFVALPGYEWSGNTAVGGDRNVYFREEGRPIRRSSHALLADRSDIDTDCTTASALFDALKGEDAVAYAHVGGRWADLRAAHDGEIERAVEIHSAWGTFEWIAHDAFALGHRVGIVANSDGHKGRPGASWPGAATFGAYGGLTCFLTPQCTRDGVLGAIRTRRTYATTGARLDLQVDAHLPAGSAVYADDPTLGPTTSQPATTAQMGDVVRVSADAVQVDVAVSAASPIAAIEVRAGAELVARVRPSNALGGRIAVRWQGALYRGRGRQAAWDGTAAFHDCTVRSVTRINAFNPDHRFIVDGAEVAFEAVTTGNDGGFDARIDEGPRARLEVRTNRGDLSVPLCALDADGVRVSSDGLDLALSARRLPDDNPHRDATATVTVPIAPRGDTPIWVSVILEDGHRAWSSPIYAFREQP